MSGMIVTPLASITGLELTTVCIAPVHCTRSQIKDSIIIICNSAHIPKGACANSQCAASKRQFSASPILADIAHYKDFLSTMASWFCFMAPESVQHKPIQSVHLLEKRSPLTRTQVSDWTQNL